MDSTLRLGELMQKEGALSGDQVQKILDFQKEKPDILFGQIAIKLGFVTNEIVNEYLGISIYKK